LTLTGQKQITRRHFVKSGGALTAGLLGSSLAGCTGVASGGRRRKSDIRIEHISFGYDEYVFVRGTNFFG
jgi:hypothetical protein